MSQNWLKVLVRNSLCPPPPSPLSMENLLEKLSKQAMVEAREALRQLVSTLNGLAGVHILADKVGLECGGVVLVM